MENKLSDEFRKSTLPKILVGRDTEIVQLLYTQIINQQTLIKYKFEEIEKRGVRIPLSCQNSGSGKTTFGKRVQKTLSIVRIFKN